MIPPRESAAYRDAQAFLNRVGKPVAKTTSEDFAEVDIAEHAANSCSSATLQAQTQALGETGEWPVLSHPVITQAQALEVPDPQLDDARALFREMRQIAHQNYWSWHTLSNEAVFYQQALLMESFSDYCQEEASEFSHYYPSYSHMDTAQLHTYFAWRTKVREGRIYETSVSYAFLYIYELLHNIGVSSPQEGLERLVEFWAEFRVFKPVIDKYVVSWLKDYHVFYSLEKSFSEFATENLMQEFYPTVFCYTSDRNNSFELFSSISAYPIEKSKFYTEETAPLIKECFFFVLTQLREAFQKKRRCFEDQVFHVTKRATRWTPFSSALFYAHFYPQSERVVHISSRERYAYSHGRWSVRSVLSSKPGSKLVGYVFREVEAFLRRVKQYKPKLTANLDSCKTVDQSVFEQLGISVPHVVKEACAEFYRLHTHKKVTVKRENLEQIRREAYDTQEKLLVAEKEATTAKRESSRLPLSTTISPKRHCEESNDEAIEIEEQGLPCKQTATCNDKTASQPFSLQSNEVEALALILQGGDVKGFAREQGIMLEVLIDTLNEKVMESIGDTVMELDGEEVFVFEDYREELCALIQKEDC